jgi:hypothetical protein
VPLLRGRKPALDTQEYKVETKYCDDCERHYARVTGFVHAPDGGHTLAAYYAVCHGHPEHEVALDLVLGTWGDDDPGDHETFSCLLRPYRSRLKPYGVMALDPFLTLHYGIEDQIPAWMGRQMSREDALQSPRIKTVWAIVDALAATVDPITEQVRTYRGPRTARTAGEEPV